MKTAQTHLSAESALVERVTSTGNVVRLELKPLANDEVKILAYHRKTVGSREFKRVRSEEGAVYPFARLNLDASFDDLFGLSEAA